jgi:ABC-type antimicrobial peptide transport system permease subunit
MHDEKLGDSMNGRDIAELSFRNLLRRKTRTLLAIIGVIIGICAIVVMLSIGYGLQQGFADSLSSWGNLHLVNVYGGSSGGGGVYYSGGGAVSSSSSSSSGNDKQVKLDDKAVTAIEKIQYVTAVSPWESTWLTFGIG